MIRTLTTAEIEAIIVRTLGDRDVYVLERDEVGYRPATWREGHTNERIAEIEDMLNDYRTIADMSWFVAERKLRNKLRELYWRLERESRGIMLHTK